MDDTKKFLIIDDIIEREDNLPARFRSALSSGITAAAAILQLPKHDIELKPGEMWPDGKVRPHAVKTEAGETVWLTDAEFDELLLQARHKHYANKQPASSAPKPRLKIGDRVTPIYPDDPDHDGWPHFYVRKIKADGRVILEALNDDLGVLAGGAVVTIGEQDYVVIRASGGSVTLRLKR